MKKIKIIGIYSGIMGTLYIFLGMVELASWIFGLQISFIGADVMGALIMLLIGSILLYRIGALLDMKYEGLAFLFVGLVLSAIIGIMYILIISADIIDALIVGESWDFSLESYNLPAIMLFLLLLPAWEIMRHREEFRE